jgi:fibronectin type 3 domain-containing protein
MKCSTNSHVLELRRIAMFLAMFVVAATSEAALYTTSIHTPYAGQSWTNAIWQPGLATPTSGNTYEILAGGVVQNPSGDIVVFPGDALTLDHGARLQLKGTAPETLSFPGIAGTAGLILNGGRIQLGDDNTFTIDGQIAVAADSVVDLGSGSRNLVITAQLSGGGSLSLFSGSPADLLDIQSTNNSYAGDWLVIRGYLQGTGENSLGTGNITVSNGILEINYDLQTSGALTLLGSNSVMVLHQDCQFTAVTINGTELAPGTYSYADLAAQFPVNFAQGGSGSITVGPPVLVSEAPSPTGNTPSNSSSTVSSNITNVVDAPATNSPSSPAIFGILDTIAPTTPNIETVSANSPSQITLSWSPSTDSGGSGLAGYLVFRGGVLIATTVGTSFTDGKLSAGTQYCYQIVAFDIAGNDSPLGASVCVTTTGGASTTGVASAPSTSSGVTVLVNSSSQITLSWSPSTDAGGSGLAGYLVFRGGVLIGTTTGTRFADSGLTAGTQYCYTIKAYDNAGNDSTVSSQTCATTLPPPIVTPAAPSNLAVASVTSSSATLNWQDNSNNETEFEIERAATAAGPWNLMGTTAANVTSYTDTGLTPSTTYYYRVLSYAKDQ